MQFKQMSPQRKDCAAVQIRTLFRSTLRKCQQLGIDEAAESTGRAVEMSSNLVARSLLDISCQPNTGPKRAKFINCARTSQVWDPLHSAQQSLANAVG